MKNRAFGAARRNIQEEPAGGRRSESLQGSAGLKGGVAVMNAGELETVFLPLRCREKGSPAGSPRDTDDQILRGGRTHGLRAQGVAQPVGILRIVDVAVGIQIGIDGTGRNHRLRRLQEDLLAPRSGQSLGVAVVRKLDGRRRKGRSGGSIHQDPDGRGLGDDFARRVRDPEETGIKPVPGRPVPGADGNGFAGTGIAEDLQVHSRSTQATFTFSRSFRPKPRELASDCRRLPASVMTELSRQWSADITLRDPRVSVWSAFMGIASLKQFMRSYHKI